MPTRSRGFLSRRAFLRLGGIAALAGVAAPGLARAQRDTVKLGAVLPFSGPLQAFGPQARAGLDLAAAQINGANGILGRQIEILYRDDMTQADVGRGLARSLIKLDLVQAIVGPVTSSARNAMAATANDLKTPLLYATDYEGGDCGDYLFFFDMVPNQSAGPLMRYLYRHAGKSFFMVGADYVWPRKMFEASKAVLQKLGGKVLGEEFVPLESGRDYAGLVERIAASGAEVVALALPGDNHAVFLEQARRQDLLRKVAVGVLADMQVYASAFPARSGERIYACVPFVASDPTPGVRAFVAAIRPFLKGAPGPSSYTMTHYNAVMALKAALERKGEVSREAAATGLAGLKYQIPTGASSISAENHHSTLNAYISAADGSDVEVVESLGKIAPEPGCTLLSR